MHILWYRRPCCQQQPVLCTHLYLGYVDMKWSPTMVFTHYDYYEYVKHNHHGFSLQKLEWHHTLFCIGRWENVQVKCILCWYMVYFVCCDWCWGLYFVFFMICILFVIHSVGVSDDVMRCLVGHLLMLLQNATAHSLDELQLCKVSKPYSIGWHRSGVSVRHMTCAIKHDLSCEKN